MPKHLRPLVKLRPLQRKLLMINLPKKQLIKQKLKKKHTRRKRLKFKKEELKLIKLGEIEKPEKLQMLQKLPLKPQNWPQQQLLRQKELLNWPEKLH
jgi:hypothetical protein